VDCDPETGNVDVHLLAELLRTLPAQGRRVAAVATVDLFGRCADYGSILPLCAEHGIPVVEDAAEALGATYRGRPAGTFGQVVTLSFNGNKVMTTSGGGALLSDDTRLAERVRYLSRQAREPVAHYEHTEIGFNYRMSNLLAALGRAQLETLPMRVAARRRIRDRYRKLLDDVPGISFKPEAAYGTSNACLTCLVIDPYAFGRDRETVRLALEAEDIEARPLWKPMHLQPIFASHATFGGEVGARLFERGLCLPSGSSLADEDQDRVVATVLSARRT
jgi:dTDP-4-amino-4,6-dideoxygalactose transaminase